MRCLSAFVRVVIPVIFVVGAARQADARPLRTGGQGSPLLIAREPPPRLTPSQQLRGGSEKIHPVFSVSLFHPVGLPWSARYSVAGLSLNIFYGVSSGLYGLEVGGIVNRVKGSVRGIQIAGAVNLVDETVYGLQLAGFVNKAKRCYGICIGGLTNVHAWNKGIQISAVYNFAREGGYGAMITGGFNLTEDPFKGLQIATATWTGGRFTGLQIGVVNRGRGLKGVQIGVTNFACGRMEGLQLGFFNFARELRGVQIGAFNVSLRNGLPFMVGMNVGW